MTCKDCRHYGFYQMITSGKPYHYAGKIPCLTCSRFTPTQDNFEPAKTKGYGEQHPCPVKKCRA